MNKLKLKFKKFLSRVRFRIKTAEYMRVTYTHPRSVVLITTRLTGKDNVLPVDWHIPLSFNPKLYAIALDAKNYSTAIIKETGVFAVNFMPAKFEKEIVACGNISGRENDKFQLLDLSKAEAKIINVPVLLDSYGYMECRVIETHLTGDHTLFIAKVLYEKLDKDPEKLQVYHISRL